MTLREWIDAWYKTGLMGAQTYTSLYTLRDEVLDEPFAEWAETISAPYLRRLRRMGMRGVVTMYSLMRLSGYELKGYIPEADPRELLDLHRV